MAILSCHVSIKLPPKISDGQAFFFLGRRRLVLDRLPRRQGLALEPNRGDHRTRIQPACRSQPGRVQPVGQLDRHGLRQWDCSALTLGPGPSDRRVTCPRRKHRMPGVPPRQDDPGDSQPRPDHAALGYGDRPADWPAAGAPRQCPLGFVQRRRPPARNGFRRRPGLFLARRSADLRQCRTDLMLGSGHHRP